MSLDDQLRRISELVHSTLSRPSEVLLSDHWGSRKRTLAAGLRACRADPRDMAAHG
jgi:hypothetical protein